MLTVIKRSGKREAFSAEKIKASLAIASDELGEPLNKSDLRHICDKIAVQFQARDEVTSKELYTFLVSQLEAQGYDKLASAYRNSVKNYWAKE